ncbi:MAG: cytochrome b/b6 domain-containing protein [Sedimenticolaceae bacterium]|jgi:cytochrome b
MQLERDRVQVWDPFVRVFHWSLVLAFIMAWASAEEWDWLHEQTGYFILVLVGLRTLWGLLGSSHARFSDFLYSPGRTLAYLRGLRSGRPQHYLGHNPAGGWMVIALLLTLLATGASGMLIGGNEHGYWKDLHEGFANLTVALVLVHVGGVLMASVLHRENLVRSMWTGMKLRRSEDV